VIVGIISDTHGQLRPQAVAALAGVAQIIHAGDVGDPAILDELRQIAPVTAVRGNVDREAWAAALPETAVVEAGELLLYVLHDREQLDLNPAAAGFRAVIFGHSHRPLVEERQGVLYLNPGSAGPRRFHLPVSVARLKIEGAHIEAEIVALEVSST
jgi:uncharacterized protein